MKIELIRSYKIEDAVFIYNKSTTDRRQFMKLFFYGFAASSLGIGQLCHADDSIINSHINSNYTGTSQYPSLSIQAIPQKREVILYEFQREQDRISKTLAEVQLNNLILDKQELSSGEMTSGKITVINESAKKVNGKIELTLLNEWDISELSKQRMTISLEPKTINEFQFSDGPMLNIKNKIDAKFTAQSKLITLEKKIPIIMGA